MNENRDDYAILMERLDFPSSTRLRPILEHIMTPEQAQMIVALPGTIEDVAEKTGIDAGKVREALDDMFFKGVIFPRGDFKTREYFRFARSIGQFHDATMADGKLDVEKDRRFYELCYEFVMNEMYPSFAEGFKRRNKRVDRIIPAYKSIKDLDDILPSENFPEMLKAQERIAVAPCSCRYCTDSVGERCDVHDEVAHWACIQFGRAADYIIARGSGKELSIEEALELSDICEESGLLHKWENHSTIVGPRLTCQCCRDCCMLTVPIDQAGLDISLIWEKSRYEAYVNLEDCDGCQVCVDRCLFDAIEMERPEGSKKYKPVIDPEKCFGCGVCVVGCEQEALKMKVVRPPEYIPEQA
jgi:NAD-dependent dihydropyrimidine dehydrogenase PreA subunit